MKKMIMSALLLSFAAYGFAQAQTPAQATDVVAGQSEWLAAFTSVEVNAALDLRFVQVPVTQAPRITYDTKGATDIKFKAIVKKQVLSITESSNRHRTDRTTVVVEYNDLQRITLENCTAIFDSPVVATMLDLTVGGTAIVTASLDVQDAAIQATGRSSVTLSGKARYLSLYASTGRFEAMQLEVMAAQVNITSGAAVSLWITDRLEAKTSTGGKLTYKGTPGVVRGGSKFMGGTITHHQ